MKTMRVWSFKGEEFFRDWYTGLKIESAWKQYKGYALIVGIGWFETGIENGERYWNAA